VRASWSGKEHGIDPRRAAVGDGEADPDKSPRGRLTAGQGDARGAGDAGGSRIAELEARLRAAERERDALTEREADLRGMANAGLRAQAEFLALMSHELRTPLNAITGYIDLLRLHLHGPLSPEQEADLSHVARNAQQLLLLVTDLLNLTRLARAEVRPQIEVVLVRELFDVVDPIGEFQAARKGLTYGRVDCDRSIAVYADRALAQQVMRNLLSNAVKYTSVPGTVTRLCVADASVVRVGVRDTGRGIPPARLAEIFGPFVAADPGDFPDRGRGVGLGLAVGRELARLMRGEIEVESVLGVGSTFTLALPRAPS
jgi:signal transduction histidine kinase